MKTYIYTLSDPETNTIRYVGKTVNIKGRLKQHIRESVIGKNHKAYWIKSLTRNNITPILEIIDETDDTEWEWLEIYWIAQFKAWGFNLVNSTSGGGKTIFNENARINMRLGQLGKKQSQETIQKRTKQITGMKRSEKFKEDARKRKLGTKHSEEAKKKMSEKRIGKKIHTEEHKNKIRIKVNQLDLNNNIVKSWNSISDAIKEYPYAKISECINKKRKTTYGYKWEKQ